MLHRLLLIAASFVFVAFTVLAGEDKKSPLANQKLPEMKFNDVKASDLPQDTISFVHSWQPPNQNFQGHLPLLRGESFDWGRLFCRRELIRPGRCRAWNDLRGNCRDRARRPVQPCF